MIHDLFQHGGVYINSSSKRFCHKNTEVSFSSQYERTEYRGLLSIGYEMYADTNRMMINLNYLYRVACYAHRKIYDLISSKSGNILRANETIIDNRINILLRVEREIFLLEITDTDNSVSCPPHVIVARCSVKTWSDILEFIGDPYDIFPSLREEIELMDLIIQIK